MSRLLRASVAGRLANPPRRWTMPSTMSAAPTIISSTAVVVSGPLRDGSGRAEAPTTLRMITAATPITHPMRKGSAALFRLGDSKIKMVTVMGTVLSATATAIGSSPPECLPHRA